MPNDQPKPFHARQHATLATHVQREIERRILSGEIKAGERIGEAALAESLGVSRGPIREALRTLAQAGLVDLLANKGAIARSIGLDEAKKLYALRGALFALACQEVARSRSEETLALLKRNMEAMRDAHRAGDVEEYYRLNVEFHAAIMDRSGNERAISVYHSVVKEMHLFRRRGLSVVPNIAESIAEHDVIVAAIDRRDPDAAREAGRIHIEHGCKRFVDTLGEEPAVPTASADRRVG